MIRNQFLLLACLFAIATACAPKKTPTHASTEPNPMSPVLSDMTQRMDELQKASNEFSAVAKQLPGRDSTRDRTLSADAFDRASSALVILGGPTPGGAFRQNLRIMDDTRQHLSNNPVDATYDPTIDTGLRALNNALIDVATHLFPNDAEVRKLLDAAAARVDDLDTVRGPLHALAASHVFRATADVIETMSQKLQGRATTTQPATQP
jgi:hypothetical protein